VIKGSQLANLRRTGSLISAMREEAIGSEELDLAGLASFFTTWIFIALVI